MFIFFSFWARGWKAAPELSVLKNDVSEDDLEKTSLFLKNSSFSKQTLVHGEGGTLYES